MLGRTGLACRGLLLLAVSSCGDSTSPGSSLREPPPVSSAPTLASPSASTEPVQRGLGVELDSGYVSLEALPFELSDGEQRESFVAPPARLFYQLGPSDDPSLDRLCVVFNGGPGVGSEQLWRWIGPHTPTPLTTLCHVLFLDARNTGLSYELVDDPESYEPSIADYNTYLDAADHLRALEQVIAQHLDRPPSSIVLVGESYGGVRVTLMLDLLLRRSDYESLERPFHAPKLYEDLDRLQLQLPIADVFTHQVLLQPTLAGTLQDEMVGRLMLEPDSVLRKLAAEQQFELLECSDGDCLPYWWMWDNLVLMDVSPYDYREPNDWLDRQHDAVRAYVASEQGLLGQLARLPRPIAGLAAADRETAFRLQQPELVVADARSLIDEYGALGPNDQYFMAWNPETYDHCTSIEAQRFRADAFQSSYGGVFLANILRVKSFTTRAHFDLVNYWEALPQTLEAFSGVDGVELEQTGDRRSGQWRVVYDSGEEAVVRAPGYDASHAVGFDQPTELIEDLGQWLQEP